MIQNIRIKAFSLIGALSLALIFSLLYAMDNQPDQQNEALEKINEKPDEFESSNDTQFTDATEPLNDNFIENNDENDDNVPLENNKESLNIEPSTDERINNNTSVSNELLPTPPTPASPKTSITNQPEPEPLSILPPTASQLSLQPKQTDSFSKNSKEPIMANKQPINIGLSESNRADMATALQKLLADEYVLYTKTLNFHWNVEGKHFGPLHTLFNDQYEKLQSIIDNIAERIRAIGLFAHATMREFLSVSSLAEKIDYFPDDITMLSLLLEDHEAVIQTIRNANDLAVKINDGGSNNFLSGLLEIHEKIAWTLRAHLNK